MAIHFTTVRWKNFLSTGNAFTEIQLDQHSTTLILGENGSGKSTMLDAICFALFNRPYRNINKPQLVNSINNKGTVVELEFTIGAKSYKLVRGLKPAVFEIWVDGMLMNQDAATRDYQKHLEENILKLNFKSFTQIVILGAASFTPFMQLPAAARREVIEDILDIKIFSAMNTVLRQKMNETKEKLAAVDAKLTIAKTKAEVQQQYIATLQEDRNQRLAEIDQKVDSVLQDNEAHMRNIEAAQQEIERRIKTIAHESEVRNSLSELDERIRGLKRIAESALKEVTFYHNNDNCPKCKQGIAHDFKDKVVAEHQVEAEEAEKMAERLHQDSKALVSSIAEIERVSKEIDALQHTISAEQNEMQSNHRFVQRLELERVEITKKVGNIEAEKQKLKDIAIDALGVAQERTEINETQHYYEIASVLLKDTGIKTRIIKQYLPVINKLVNKFLTTMDFFVQFTLDERFNEVIKSRHRDEFSYESFSEGEKQRIDLALLFTWRTIAKLKNSASTNLLILDEIFDSSLDNSATEQVMTLLNTLGEDANVWVISHKGDQLFDRFTNTIRFKKHNNFSVCQ